jgi:hypothetical protein
VSLTFAALALGAGAGVLAAPGYFGLYSELTASPPS